jgi:Beta-ketoacyl synthase, N-terminal domain
VPTASRLSSVPAPSPAPDDASATLLAGAGAGGSAPVGLAGVELGWLRGAGLAVLASAEYPASATDVLPEIVRFVVSSFSPLVAELGERCLRRYFGARPADPDLGEQTGVVLASKSGDFGTAVAVAEAVDAGRRVPPMLFYQSNPNAVVGYLTARWGLGGPVVCTSPAADVPADAVADAGQLIRDGDAAAVLVIVAEQGRPGLPGVTGGAESHDHGLALLIGPSSWPHSRSSEPIGGLS